MRRIAQVSLTTFLSIALFAACNNREIASVEPAPNKEQFKDIPVDLNRDIDLLFVVDNSGSMLEEQMSLTTNFQRFIGVLENIEGGLPNVHIGVISTDMGVGQWVETGCSSNGDNGSLRTNPVCGINNAYIQDIEDGNGGRSTNYAGSLADAFSCLATLGTTGCGFEQPLKSMQKALDGSNPANNGFLRDNAFLAIIFVTDEDDCSVRDNNMFDTTQTGNETELGPLSSFRCFEFGVKCDPDSPRQPGARTDCVPRDDSPYMTVIEEHINFLKNLKGDPNQVIVAGIIGNPTPVTVTTDPSNNNRPILAPSCTSASGEAAAGVRLKFFLDAFPQRSTFTTICNDNLEDALILIAELLKKIIGNPCLDGNIDTDLNTPGVQYECQVSDVRYPDTPMQEESIIPNCAVSGGALPCYDIQPNPTQCSETATQLELIINRSGSEVPIGTHVQARCVVQ